MPKRTSEPVAGSDKAKVRVFFAEVDGNNESVQEALKTMLLAMSRTSRVVPEHRLSGSSAAVIEQAEHEGAEATADGTEEPAEAHEEPTASPTRKIRGTGKKLDRNSGLEIVPDMNFMPSDKENLSDFLGRKRFEKDTEMVVAIVYYMQNLMKLPKIGPAHVLSAFKAANKPVPVDLRATIRNVKKSRAYLKFNDMEDIRMTTQGDNFIEHETSKAK